MADKPERSSEFRDKDERVSLAPLTPEEALRALLAVKPDDDPVSPEHSDSAFRNDHGGDS